MNEQFGLQRNNIKNFITDELIITAATAGIFLMIKAGNMKLPKTSPDPMNIVKLPGRRCWGGLVKD